MSIDYRVDGVTYSLSYKELKSEHERLCSLSDEEFLDSLPEILHLACIISYLKELTAETVLSDRGVIHLIAHQLHIKNSCTHEVQVLRERFETVLKLS